MEVVVDDVVVCRALLMWVSLLVLLLSVLVVCVLSLFVVVSLVFVGCCLLGNVRCLVCVLLLTRCCRRHCVCACVWLFGRLVVGGGLDDLCYVLLLLVVVCVCLCLCV